SIERRPVVHDRRQVAAEIGVLARNGLVEQITVTEYGALAGIGQDDEFVAEITADRAGIRTHRDRGKPQAGIGAQIGHEHALVGLDCRFLGEIEGIGILHQEFAAAHGAEARTDLVPTFPLDVIEVEREVLVGLYVAPEDVGDHLLIGGTIEEFALVPILNAQHLLAIGIIATAFAP